MAGGLDTGSPGHAGRPRPAWCTTVDGQAVAFFAHHLRAINRVINDTCVAQQYRDDIRQEVAIRLLNRFRRYGPLVGTGHVGFVIKVTRNACIDHFRRLPPKAAQVDDMPIRETAPNPEEQLVRMQGHERLHWAIAGLPPVKRYIVRQVMAGRTLVQVAAELERTHSSVKVLHHRAVQDLRKTLIKR
ncbi:MAG TPA: sigma-70 family RNA polymerase sigma factor [Flavobacteriales bacterium]|nr:sigma-70 family RNA polymerase sigma factor [Flavobacteriales bacterium]